MGVVTAKLADGRRLFHLGEVTEADPASTIGAVHVNAQPRAPKSHSDDSDMQHGVPGKASKNPLTGPHLLEVLEVDILCLAALGSEDWSHLVCEKKRMKFT